MDTSFLGKINEEFGQGKISASQQSGLVLAYIGDAVYDMIIRTYICAGKETKVNQLHRKAIKYVKAKAQSDIFQAVESKLTEEEIAVYRRGRNAKSATVPKNADLIDYRRATGFEALVGYLYLEKQYDRLIEIIKYGIAEIENEVHQ